MSSYEDRCVEIGVVFHALYFENEVGDPPIFFISGIANSLSDCSQSMKKICIVEVFRANVLKLAWENSRRFEGSPLEPSQNGVWVTRAEIPYWWRVTTQIKVVLLIGWIVREFRFNQSEALPRSG